MFNTLSQKANENPNDTEILSQPSQNSYLQENNKFWQGLGRRKGTHMHCWWECKLVQSLWKSVWRFIKIDLPYDPAISFLGSYLKSTYKSDTAHYLYCSTVHNSQTMESPLVPNHQRLDKENVVYIHSGVLFSHKEERNYVICRKMDGSDDQCVE
jgi:hypothetical protein